MKLLVKLKILEIYEYNILFHTGNNQYNILLPRSLFPSDIKKNDENTLNIKDLTKDSITFVDINSIINY